MKKQIKIEEAEKLMIMEFRVEGQGGYWEVVGFFDNLEDIAKFRKSRPSPYTQVVLKTQMLKGA